MKPRSIRRRIQGWFLMLTAVLLAAFSVALYLQTAANGLAKLDQSLRVRAFGLAAACEAENEELHFDPRQQPAAGDGAEPRHGFVVIAWPGARELYRSPNVREVPGLVPDAGVVGNLAAGQCVSRDLAASPGGVSFRHCVLLYEVRDHDETDSLALQVVLAIAEDQAPLHRELRSFGLQLLLIWSLAMSLAAAAGSFLARRIADPLARIAKETSLVEARSTGLVTPTGTGDEIDQVVESLNRALLRLRAAYQRQTRFTADASHELRTPLAVILTAGEVALRKERDGAEYRAALAQIVTSAQRSEETQVGLLLLARADAGRLQHRLEPLELAAVAKEVAADKDRVQCSSSGDSSLLGDHRLLSMLVENLVANALRYSPATVSVEVSVVTTPSSVRLEVRDRGIGIAADMLPHVFEPFYRTDAARNRMAGGSGLGLAIVRAIAELHGAQCTIHSREGEGTSVFVDFPHRNEAPRQGLPADLTA